MHRFRHPALLLCIACALLNGQNYTAPAGERHAARKSGSAVLPGGRVIHPLGEQRASAGEPLAIAVNDSGSAVLVAGGEANGGALVMVERRGPEEWMARSLTPQGMEALTVFGASEWREVSDGLAFSGERAFFISEGASGQIGVIDWEAGRGRSIDLNEQGYSNSKAGVMAFDSVRWRLYAADITNSRIAIVDARTRQVIASAPAGGVPGALALSPDGRRLYVAVSAGDRQRVCVVDVSGPAPLPGKCFDLALEDRPAGTKAGLAADGDRVYVSDPARDTVISVDPGTGAMSEIAIRIPNLENLRGVMPCGLAFHAPSGLLLVAEAGINAIGVIDPKAARVVGHLPAGWFPTMVAARGETVFVANAKGRGSGPNDPTRMPGAVTSQARRFGGTVSIFSMPRREEFAAHTEFVMEANGFLPSKMVRPSFPEALRHVVLIVKGNRSYDEVLGGIDQASNGLAMGSPELARFGMRGYVDGGGKRLSIRDVTITPNHRAIASGWAFSDNFYASPRNGMLSEPAVRTHLASHGARAIEIGGQAEGAVVSDQRRADNFIREMEQKYARALSGELPGFILLRLPNDAMGEARPDEGYPYPESFVADNDLALGRVLEYLSTTKWWPRMAVFVAENGSGGGWDHIDSQRSILLCAGPWARKTYVSHRNTDFHSLLKTVFQILGAPPMTLQDAVAADLSDCFTDEADAARYQAAPIDKRIFDPEP